MHFCIRQKTNKQTYSFGMTCVCTKKVSKWRTRAAATVTKSSRWKFLRILIRFCFPADSVSWRCAPHATSFSQSVDGIVQSKESSVQGAWEAALSPLSAGRRGILLPVFSAPESRVRVRMRSLRPDPFCAWVTTLRRRTRRHMFPPSSRESRRLFAEVPTSLCFLASTPRAAGWCGAKRRAGDVVEKAS